jgi:hypothetical protein
VTLSHPHENAIAALREIDARMEREAENPLRSLAPDRARATPLAELADACLGAEDDAAVAAAFCRGLGVLGLAQLEAFPGNLFWDLDYVAAVAIERARNGSDPEASLDQRFGLMAELQHLYGGGTVINFSFVHDFTYGFDWAKWVGREPEQDGSVGPFDMEFLRYMKRRAGELEELIATDDGKYPQLPEGEVRNPFPFSREPEAELRLFPALVERKLIPVETWRLDARPDCTRPFYDLRVDVARELGI